MGAQSVLVRLLMKGIPQTNVMTGNMTQLGIAVPAVIETPSRHDQLGHGDAAVRDFDNARRRLVTVLAIALGFLAGAVQARGGEGQRPGRGAVAAVAIVGALALWAMVREG